jgi:hypothetical protein
MPNKIMVASGQKGYHACLVNEQEQIIQVGANTHLKRLQALNDAAGWSQRASLWFDDSRIIPHVNVTRAQRQVGQQRSVRAYLGA